MQSYESKWSNYLNEGFDDDIDNVSVKKVDKGGKEYLRQAIPSIRIKNNGKEIKKHDKPTVGINWGGELNKWEHDLKDNKKLTFMIVAGDYRVAYEVELRDEDKFKEKPKQVYLDDLGSSTTAIEAKKGLQKFQNYINSSKNFSFDVDFPETTEEKYS